MTTKFGRSLTHLLSVAVAMLLGWNIPCNAATRIAIVSGERGSAVTNATDLAQVKLSADERLVMLERDEIRRILDEQKLTVTGLVDATQVIAVGKLLTVDLFAVVEASPSNDGAGGIIVFDARSGVRYSDAALPNVTKDLEAASQAIVTAVHEADSKRGRLEKGLHTVGFVTVRNADLPRAQDGLCEAVGFLAERGLPRSADIAVLERRRLERVNEERTLPAAADPTELLASLSTIELEIARGPEGKGLQATALVKHTGKEQTEKVTATVGDMNAAALADSLVDKLIALLKAAPAPALPNRKVEAIRYDREATHHNSHQRFADMVRAQEAAHALDPENGDYQERLSMYLLRYAIWLFSPKELFVTKGGSGDRAWTDTLVEPDVFERLIAAANRSLEFNQLLNRPTAHFPTYNQPLGMLCDRLRGYRKNSTNHLTSLADDFLLRCLRRSLDYCESRARKAEADPKLLDQYTSNLEFQARLIKSASVDTKQYADSLSQIAGRWLEVTKGWKPQFNTTDGGEILTTLLHGLVKPTNWPWNCDERQFAQIMAPLYTRMQQHGRPVVRLYGHAGAIRSDILLEQDSEDAGYKRFASIYRPMAQSIIASPEPWHPARTRFAAYEAWRTAIADMPGTPKTRQDFEAREITELCDFTIERKELAYKSLQQALWVLDDVAKLDLIARALPVVDSAQFKETDSEKTRLRSLLKSEEQKIHVKNPELAKVPAKLPWTKTTKLYESGQFRELSELVACVPARNVLYAVCLQFEKDQAGLRLLRIPLTGDKADLLAHVDLALPAAAVAPHMRRRYVTATAIDDEFLYLATNGAGIVVFPLKGEQTRLFNVASGLPSNNVLSIAVLDGKIYAGFSDGYMASVDPKSGQCDVIASSRRKQKQSPFDDGDVFRVPTLVADPQRQRLVFVIGKQAWQLKPSDGKITPIIDLIAVARGRSEPKLTGANIDWSGSVHGDRILVANVFHTIEIDLAHDRAVEINAPEFGFFETQPPQLVIDGTLWSGGSFSHLSLDKRVFQALPGPDEKKGAFRPTICLELAANQKQLVAADQYSVWLYDLQR